MKAIILAGGEGTRLRPVTGATPKPLAPLLGRPLMEHILRLLKKHGFHQVCASVCYRAEEIEAAFGDGSALGMELCYRAEDRPLGTAGGVKLCADFIGEEDVLIISADAACDFDLGLLMEKHRQSGAAATLALYREAEPLRYGLAVTDEGGFIRAFIEKPAWSRVVTDMLNTGVYVLSPRALAAIPEGEDFDFAKDLFPLLLDRGETLLGLPMEGYWADVGTPLSYYRCCVDALEGRLHLEPGEAFRPAVQPTAGEEAGEAEGLSCPCRSRAALMDALSRSMLEMNADFSDGIRLHGRNYELHIAPEARRSAIRIAVQSPDAEFARSLALSAKELAEAFDL